MPSAIDLIGRNPALQEHWIRRFFAGLIDGIVVAVVYLLFVLPLAFLGLAWYVAPLLYGAVWVVYSMLLEALFSATIGKRLLKLRVVADPTPMPQARPRKTTPPPAPGSAQAAPTAQGSWPQQGTGWPGAAPAPNTWPQHQWDEQGRLVKEMKFCTACGGQLVARGDGKLTCVRCGAVY